MEKLKIKINSIQQALLALKKIITDVSKEGFLETRDKQKKQTIQEYLRDAMIQRFEYCIDLFWNVLKVYLEDYEKIGLDTPSPRNIIREATKIKLISEDEGSQFMEMITNRNKTSHMYHREIAEEIAEQVPEFYELKSKTIQRVQDRVAGQ